MLETPVWIVIPSYFDSVPFLRVRKEALECLAPFSFSTRFVYIDDAAGRDPGVTVLSTLSDVRVLNQPRNLGHQKALVSSLRALRAEIGDEDLVVTMDADGEDRPTDLAELLKPLLNPHPEPLVCLARRTEREEGPIFKIFYNLFKLMFVFLTGTVIRNGNYAAYRGRTLKSIISHPAFDRCYSSSFVSLKLPIRFVPLPRGRRYFGESKMGFQKLVLHGLRMLLPFGERIVVRMGFLFCLAVLGIIIWRSSLK